MARHNDIGKWGENIACDILVGKGYAIIERNWRLNHLEIDIIASKGSRIVFAEVKTRGNAKYRTCRGQPMFISGRTTSSSNRSLTYSEYQALPTAIKLNT